MQKCVVNDIRLLEKKREQNNHGRTNQNQRKASQTGFGSLVREQEVPYEVGNITDILSRGVKEGLFPGHLELVPQLNEVYELELAFYESRILTDEEIIRNGAYFAQVGDTLTRHFLMCSGEPVRLPQHSSSRLRSFFHTNQFKTGYATHGLFPYRGKFHPQMIKGLINVMGLKPGDTGS